MTNPNRIIEKVTANIDTSFGKRILNLVLFGSQVKGIGGEDIDLHLLLDKPQDQDLYLISQAIPKSPIKIDFALSYKKDLDTPYILRVRNHGRHILYPLALGKILLGKGNYYKRLINKQDKKQVLEDLLIKNKEHHNGLRDTLIEKDILKKQKKLAKYLIRYAGQTLLATRGITYQEIIKFPKSELLERLEQSALLESSEIDLLISLANEKQKSAKQCILEITKLLYKLDSFNDFLIKEHYANW